MRRYHTKRIALPGGKFVEIVFFGEDSDDALGLGAQDAVEVGGTVEDDLLDLQSCPDCASELVYPVGWEERRSDRWEITLRCPNCEWWHTGEYGDDEVERFDDVLNDGTEQLLSVLRTFSRANMEEDVERLIDAIQCDLILPMDF